MKFKMKHIHIAIIILGIIFLSLSAFHTSLWFDESYSVAIAKHGFADIWRITGNDVHPALYYWGLHIVYLIFGNNVLAYRLFSLLATIILSILGYTHIRKDFGEKTGIFFSFLACFLPIMTACSQEIRMYSWSCLLVTVAAIYAYRFYKNVKEKQEKDKTKNLIIFGIFSICCCYIHYYALATTALINLILLIYLIKNRKEDKKALIYFLILALVQVVLYIPWLIYLARQVNHVKSGFWISFNLFTTPTELLSYQFRRQLETVFTYDAQTIIALVVALLMYAYLIFKIVKQRKDLKNIKPGITSFLVYIGVILITFIISIIMKQSIFFARYLFVMTGLYIFGIANILSTETKKSIIFGICTTIVILATFANIKNINLNYDSGSKELYQYINNEIQEDDIIVYSNIGNGGVIAAYFPENKQYFLNLQYWDVEEAYKAYGPGMETVYNFDFLKDYSGRIWIIDSEYPDLYLKNFPMEGIKVLREPKRIDSAYHEYIYNIILLEK